MSAWAECAVCGAQHRVVRGCSSCRWEVLSSDDVRWAVWAAYMLQHPEVRPVPQHKGRSGRTPKRCWSETKVANVDAWLANRRAAATAKVPTIDDYGGARSYVMGPW